MIDNGEDLHIVMPMYYLLEYSQSHYVTSGNLWNYYRDKIDNGHYIASGGKSFTYKTKIVGKHHKYHHSVVVQEMQIYQHNQQYQL